MRAIPTQTVIDRGERSGASVADRQAADVIAANERRCAASLRASEDSAGVPFEARVDAAAKAVHLRWGGRLAVPVDTIRAIVTDAITAADRATLR